jgi:hypothetical protein
MSGEFTPIAGIETRTGRDISDGLVVLAVVVGAAVVV